MTFTLRMVVEPPIEIEEESYVPKCIQVEQPWSASQELFAMIRLINGNKWPAQIHNTLIIPILGVYPDMHWLQNLVRESMKDPSHALNYKHDIIIDQWKVRGAWVSDIKRDQRFPVPQNLVAYLSYDVIDELKDVKA